MIVLFVKQYLPIEVWRNCSLSLTGLIVEGGPHCLHTHICADPGINSGFLFLKYLSLLNRQHMTQNASSGLLSGDKRGHSGALLDHRRGNQLHKMLYFCSASKTYHCCNWCKEQTRIYGLRYCFNFEHCLFYQCHEQTWVHIFAPILKMVVTTLGFSL